jgi:hypothetical protein
MQLANVLLRTRVRDATLWCPLISGRQVTQLSGEVLGKGEPLRDIWTRLARGV